MQSLGGSIDLVSRANQEQDFPKLDHLYVDTITMSGMDTDKRDASGYFTGALLLFAAAALLWMLLPSADNPALENADGNARVVEGGVAFLMFWLVVFPLIVLSVRLAWSGYRRLRPPPRRERSVSRPEFIGPVPPQLAEQPSAPRGPNQFPSQSDAESL